LKELAVFGSLATSACGNSSIPEIAAPYNIPNVPDDIELAVKTGTRLCEDILRLQPDPNKVASMFC
jgi:hypothetical protein